MQTWKTIDGVEYVKIQAKELGVMQVTAYKKVLELAHKHGLSSCPQDTAKALLPHLDAKETKDLYDVLEAYAEEWSKRHSTKKQQVIREVWVWVCTEPYRRHLYNVIGGMPVSGYATVAECISAEVPFSADDDVPEANSGVVFLPKTRVEPEELMVFVRPNAS